jgi:DNA-binding response OmpR family regulator
MVPIVFITADTSDAVRLGQLENDAAECLFKPFTDAALLEALNAALRKNFALRQSLLRCLEYT